MCIPTELFEHGLITVNRIASASVDWALTTAWAVPSLASRALAVIVAIAYDKVYFAVAALKSLAR